MPTASSCSSFIPSAVVSAAGGLSVGDGDAAERLDGAEIGRIFCEESGRSLAALIRAFGDIDLAEDAVQEAFAAALRKWPGDGVPHNPGGWITRPPATAPSTGCAARHAAGSCSARWRCSDELPGRLRPVLAVVYLVYNAGLTSPAGPDLGAEAIRLARLLAELLPDEPEVAGLLALLLLTESRRVSRTRPDGSLVLLGDQDRTQWDRALIEAGQTILRQCVRRRQPGPYQLQAAINAVHADAPTVEATDWPQIVALYDQLLAVAPTPAVALNRAIAIAEVDGPTAALALVDDLDLDNYHPYHATRADLLRRLGRHREATVAYQRAAALAPTEAERDFLRRGGRASRSQHR